jgi:hypothetical protein
MDKTSAIARSRRNIIVSPRRRRAGGSRRAISQPSRLRRIARAVWVSPRHIALALVLGLLCGAAASRIDGSIIAPPYAATLGTLVLYPLVMFLWRRLARLARRR